MLAKQPNVLVDRAHRLATTQKAKNRLKNAQSTLQSNAVFGGEGEITI